MADSIDMEHFNTNLHGCRILCSGTFHRKYPPIMDLTKDIRNPFKKYVFISNSAFGLYKHFTCSFDAIFQAKDTHDWTMILTYISYVQKPAFIVCDVPIPDAFWSKLPRTITFVHMMTSPVANVKPYDCIFFAPADELLTVAYMDYIHKTLQIVYKPTYTQNENKVVLQELRVAKAGLVWKEGAIYWYDPVESTQMNMSNAQMSELFHWLGEQYHSE